MIAYINGTVKYMNTESIVVETAGIGYQVFATKKVLEKSKIDAEIELFIFHYLRDDAVELYGFGKKGELEFFKQLFSVSGIGPKMALAIISDLDMDQVKKSILNHDASLIQSVSGVGAKTAERAILELKNKVTLADDSDFVASGAGGRDYNELVNALVGLGYTKNEAVRLSQSVPPELEKIEDKVKFVLKNVNKTN